MNTQDNFQDATVDEFSESYHEHPDYFQGVVDYIYNNTITNSSMYDNPYHLDRLLDWKHFLYCTAHINLSAKIKQTQFL